MIEKNLNTIDGKMSGLSTLLMAACTITTCMMLYFVLKYASFGMDFSDEGYYLSMISRPFTHDFFLSIYHFVYHVIYQIVDGDIAALRRVNILITFGLSCLLCAALLRTLLPNVTSNKFFWIVISMGLATTVLTSALHISRWLPTPSYNTLTLQGLLVTALGFVLAEPKASRWSVLGWILIGMGGVLTFMGKPSSALFLALFTLLYLGFSKKITVRFILISVTTALIILLASALMISGSIAKFIEMIKYGLSITELQGSHSLYNLISYRRIIRPWQLMSWIQRIDIILFFAIYIASMYFSSSKIRWVNAIGFISLFLYFIVIVFFSMGLLGFPSWFDTVVGDFALNRFGTKSFDMGMPTLHGQTFIGLMVGVVIISSFIWSFLSYRTRFFSDVMRPHGAIIFAFIVLPYVYVFGTGIVYWVAVPAAVIFWVLGGVTLLAPQIRSSGTWTMLLSLILTLQMALVLTLYGGLESPYRQPQRVWQYDQPTKVGRTESVLTFSAVQARYIHDMTTAAEEAGLKTGTPVFNRTGHFPGILYTLQVESLGSPWPIQGYKGGENAIIAALERTSCEKIASAWVLDEPKGEKRVSSGVLPPFGADFETDYERVGVWTMPAVIAGRAEDMEQVLLKPTRPLEVATQVCLEKRRSLSSK